MTSRQQHWESVYQQRDPELVSWYQADPAQSLRFVQACGVDADVPIVDVGGGSSVLVDRLLDKGYTDVTVLDLSPTALALSRQRLGVRSESVTWIEADVTEHHFDRAYQVWHDRATFHFLTDTDDRDRYVEQLTSGVLVGGHVMIATFAPEGPDRCSGLPAQRYGEQSLRRALDADFEALEFEHETHRTPGGVTQEFLYGYFQRRPEQAT